MIFMSEQKTKWVRDLNEIPDDAEPVDNSSSQIKCFRKNGVYYYYLRTLPFNPDEIPLNMGGDKPNVL